MYLSASPADICATMKQSPLNQLFLARVRDLFRTPEAIFWVYGFPVLLAIGLGIAFRNRPPDKIYVDIVDQARAQEVKKTLDATKDFIAEIHSAEDCAARLRLGKTSIVVAVDKSFAYRYDPTRPESALARARLDEVLQRAAGRTDAAPTNEQLVVEPGARYIDFLIPGLLGMNLMGGGMWGVGFVIVDMRVRKLLKRLVATPMSRSDFLLSMVGGRLIFMVPEIALLLSTGILIFDVPIRGSLLEIGVVSLLGATSFAGIGLLTACRTDKIETISGLMNLVMLPMWLFSGIFFASERFPAALQPLVQALPLTQLNNALRAVILEGASLHTQVYPLAILAAWGLISYALALRWFRWN
jgi:ABC-type multidrug transport system permease subunit